MGVYKVMSLLRQHFGKIGVYPRLQSYECRLIEGSQKAGVHLDRNLLHSCPHCCSHQSGDLAEICHTYLLNNICSSISFSQYLLRTSLEQYVLRIFVTHICYAMFGTHICMFLLGKVVWAHQLCHEYLLRISVMHVCYAGCVMHMCRFL